MRAPSPESARAWRRRLRRLVFTASLSPWLLLLLWPGARPNLAALPGEGTASVPPLPLAEEPVPLAEEPERPTEEPKRPAGEPELHAEQPEPAPGTRERGRRPRLSAARA